jgi:dTDP-4-amino-4,6-dideoxygalactose transaminase
VSKSANSQLLPSDPREGYLAHKAAIDEAIGRVLASGRYILGPEVESFEKEFAGYIGVSHCLGVASGTDAILLCLKACGIGTGDAVITVSNTAVATVAAIELAGAIPVLVDVDPSTFTIDVKSLEAALAPGSAVRAALGKVRIKAVVPVHLFGHPADMTAIMALAEAHGLMVIEDCAQSHGARWAGKKTGAWGHMAAFSFYPTKNLGALGDGGAVGSNSQELIERARLLRQYGWRQRYISELPGLNSRLDEVQAAILRVKLPFLDQCNQRRRELAERYGRDLAGTGLVLPRELDNAYHVYHQYVVRTVRRDELQAHLQRHAILTAVLYPQPIHLQPAYRNRIVCANSLPVTEMLAKEILSLPMYPEMPPERTEEVVAAVRQSGLK